MKAQLQRAKALMLLQQYNEGCDIYFSELKAFPTNICVNNNVAICYWKDGNLELARSHFLQAINGTGFSLHPESPVLNLEDLNSWNPSSGVQARLMW